MREPCPLEVFTAVLTSDQRNHGVFCPFRFFPHIKHHTHPTQGPASGSCGDWFPSLSPLCVTSSPPRPSQVWQPKCPQMLPNGPWAAEGPPLEGQEVTVSAVKPSALPLLCETLFSLLHCHQGRWELLQAAAPGDRGTGSCCVHLCLLISRGFRLLTTPPTPASRQKPTAGSTGQKPQADGKLRQIPPALGRI